MSYVQSVLQPGEKVLATGKLHWIAYRYAIACLVLGIVVVSAEYRLLQGRKYADQTVWITSLAFAAVFVWYFVKAWLDRWLTEIAVTEKRVIYKYGLIMRHTAEMNMDKVESVDVTQSVPGRLLNYGDVLVKGTGATFEPLNDVANPIALRNAITAK